MQLENGDVGYCRMLSKLRGSALLAEREGGNKKGSVLENGGEHCSYCFQASLLVLAGRW